jgi:DNA-damage-inducible protein J
VKDYVESNRPQLGDIFVGLAPALPLALQCHTPTHPPTGVFIMAANQLVQTRIDGAIKDEAAAVLAAMGLTVSDAVRMLLTRIAHDHALPFNPLVPNETTIAAMKEARAGNLPRFDNISDLMADLHADD